MAVPLETKISFLGDVVLLSFAVRHKDEEARQEWIRSEMNIIFPVLTDDAKNRLMLLSSIIHTLEEANEERDRLLEERRQRQPTLPQAQAPPLQIVSPPLPHSVSLNSQNLPSASRIAEKERHLYDIFSLPLSPSCYIPNERLRNLLKMYHEQTVDDNVRSLECEFQKFPSSHTYRYPKGGSETKITDPILRTYFTIIQRVIQDTLPNLILTVTKDNLKIPTHMAKQNSKPEYRLQWEKFILIASEAKGIEETHIVGLIQGLELGADSAIFLKRFLDLKDVAVPVVLCYGNFFHIFGVYIFGDNFPVITALSNPISYLDYEGRFDLARWTVVLANFANATIHLIQNKQQQLYSSGTFHQLDSIQLSLSYFFKPILNIGVDSIEEYDYVNDGSLRQSCLIKIMNCYKRLDHLVNAATYFLFPVGSLSYPPGESDFYDDVKNFLTQFFRQYFPNKFSHLDSGCPILVFPMLDSSWSNVKPGPEFHASYLECVATAINMMNYAKVAHCDLRPSNIMWKVVDDTNVTIQIIDLEDSIPFDVHFKPYEGHFNDQRYPFYGQLGPVSISAFHNNWFLFAIQRWIESSQHSFDIFMRHEDYHEMQHSAEIGNDPFFDPVSYLNEQQLSPLTSTFEKVNLNDKSETKQLK